MTVYASVNPSPFLEQFKEVRLKWLELDNKVSRAEEVYFVKDFLPFRGPLSQCEKEKGLIFDGVITSVSLFPGQFHLLS